MIGHFYGHWTGQAKVPGMNLFWSLIFVSLVFGVQISSVRAEVRGYLQADEIIRAGGETHRPIHSLEDESFPVCRVYYFIYTNLLLNSGYIVSDVPGANTVSECRQMAKDHLGEHENVANGFGWKSTGKINKIEYSYREKGLSVHGSFYLGRDGNGSDKVF